MHRTTAETYPARQPAAGPLRSFPGRLGALATLCLTACGGGVPTPGPSASNDSRPVVSIPGDPEADPPLAAFELEVHEVTNDAFRRFVEATGYVTEAEILGNAAVFLFAQEGARHGGWTLLEGADWRHPEGPGSSIAERGTHPVVQVSWADAAAYAAWAGRRLPTEREWQHAARGGDAAASFPWPEGGERGALLPANVWQGPFPEHDEGLDGFVGTAPVGSFAPNGYGLFDMGGNVWEWAGDPDPVSSNLVHGGSFLCAREASVGFAPCEGYRCGTFQVKPLDDANNNVGFRCAR